MRTKLLVLFAVLALMLGVSSVAQAIAWGRPDLNGEYPNVVSVRGIVDETNVARVSCSGSLLHVDAEKVVILTAAHCTDAWIDNLGSGFIDSVGVSFDQDNVIAGSFTDATYYVRGGIPISLPAKDAPFEKLDYGMVVFSTSDENFLGETIEERWGGTPGALTPVQVAPNIDYVPKLVQQIKKSEAPSTFTSAGYGTGDKLPVPGEETGPANGSGANFETFAKRYIADNLSYNAWNPVNDVLRLSQNIALGNNGTCNGDSGGPIFHQDANLGRVQVSLVSGGDFACRATNTGPGFSRQDAFDFLSCGAVSGDTAAVVACVDSAFGG